MRLRQSTLFLTSRKYIRILRLSLLLPPYLSLSPLNVVQTCINLSCRLRWAGGRGFVQTSMEHTVLGLVV